MMYSESCKTRIPVKFPLNAPSCHWCGEKNEFSGLETSVNSGSRTFQLGTLIDEMQETQLQLQAVSQWIRLILQESQTRAVELACVKTITLHTSSA
jgi:hypothetical protein